MLSVSSVSGGGGRRAAVVVEADWPRAGRDYCLPLPLPRSRVHSLNPFEWLPWWPWPWLHPAFLLLPGLGLSHFAIAGSFQVVIIRWPRSVRPRTASRYATTGRARTSRRRGPASTRPCRAGQPPNEAAYAGRR